MMVKARTGKTLLLLGAAWLSSGAMAQSNTTDTSPAPTNVPAADPDQAQTPAPADQVGDIVVTAERRETRLQATPISITALTADALQNQGIRTINDLAASVPNLTSTTGPQGSSDANFFIRGIGQFDVIATNDPGVGLYVDGVYLGRTVGALLDSGDVARVEVLRGPQGTLFGRNTLGGAVSVTSIAPALGDFGITARGTYGSRNRVDIDGSINAPLGDSAALRLYAFTRNQDGFARNFYTGQLFGKTKREGGRAQLRIQPASNIRVDLSADYSLDKSNPAPSVNRAIAPLPFFPAGAFADRSSDFYTVFESNSPEARNRTYGFSGTVTLDLAPNTTLKSITAYRNLNGFSTSDPDGTSYRLYDQNVFTRQHQFSQELQLSGQTLDNRLTYLLGAYYFNERVDQTLALCFAPITPVPTSNFNSCNTWTQRNNQSTKSYALFGQGRFNLTDAFSITLGGRYTWETKNIVSNQYFDFRPAGFFVPPAGPVVPGFVGPIVTDLPGRVKFKAFTPKIGAEFKPSEDLLLYASYARGFRSGGFNGRLIQPQPTIPTYAPDTNDAFEVGLKSDLLNRTLRFNVTGFYQKYKGIQQTISDPAVQFRVANAGNARLYGFETEIVAVPTEGLRFNASVGYTNSRFYDVPAAVGPINGNRLPFAPDWTIATGLEYAAPVGGNGATITPRVDFRFQSLTYFSPFNLPYEFQPGYGLLNARVTFASDRTGRFTLAVYGENLTQERYYVFGQNALGAQGVAYSYLGRPREFGVTGAVKF